MQWFAFDSRKHSTWALAQSETGKHSSLFPPPYHLRPTPHSFCTTDDGEPLVGLNRPGFPGGFIV